jgi:hypothetical protein
MVLTLDTFAHWVPPFWIAAPEVPAEPSAKAPVAERAFPMLFQLHDRRTGEVVRVNGQPVDWVGTSIAAAREELLHNRDPRLFDVVVVSPNMTSVD